MSGKHSYSGMTALPFLKREMSYGSPLLKQARHLGTALLFLLLLSLAPVQSFAQQAREMTLNSTDDAYVVANLNDPFDQLGLRTLNTGTLTFLKVWYAWNVTAAGTDKITSLAYLKFDLASLDAHSISSATLELYAAKVNLTGVSRAVSVYFVPRNNWTEDSLIFNNAPSFDNKTFTQAYVSSLERYYAWDVTSMAKNQIQGQLSVMVSLALFFNHSEEQVIFNSNEAASNRPRLVVDYVGPASSSFDYLGLFLSTMPGILILPAAIGGGGVAGFFAMKRTRAKRRKHKLPLQATLSQTLPTTPTGTPASGRPMWPGLGMVIPLITSIFLSFWVINNYFYDRFFRDYVNLTLSQMYPFLLVTLGLAAGTSIVSYLLLRRRRT